MTSTRVLARYHRCAIAHVMVDCASEAIALYEQASGAIELFRIADADDHILHAEIRIADSVVMMGDAEGPFVSPRALGATTVALHVCVDDVDALYTRAVSAVIEVLQPPQDMFYGDRTAMFRDPFGHAWVFLTDQKDLDPDEIKARGEALLRG